jgi:O-antigen/teichoic acid export membrane protein
VNLQQFLIQFIRNKGGYVTLSIILGKLISFLISLIVIRLLTKPDYGLITYSSTIISLAVPLMGFGAFQGLMRYGAKLNGYSNKLQLFNYGLIRGSLFSILIIVAFILFSDFITRSLPQAKIYFIILSFQVLSLFLLEYVKSFYRLLHRNKAYSIVEIAYQIILLTFSVIFTILYDGIGFVLAMTFIPFIISVYIIVKRKWLSLKNIKFNLNIKPFEFWKYSFLVSLGALASQLLFVLDIIMLGNLLKNAQLVAVYKAASLIPLSLRFVPYMFITTDYLKFAENETNAHYLKQYIVNYSKLFIPISALTIAFFWFFSDYLVLLFGEGYQNSAYLMKIFGFAITASFIFRIPFGNILTATRWANINAYNSLLALLLNFILNYYFIKHWQLEGAAIATTITMWISGLLTFLFFVLYIKKLNR